MGRTARAMVGMAVMLVLSGCATKATQEQQVSDQAVEGQRLTTIAFQAGAQALGHDSMTDVPIDAYRILNDPDREAFADIPSLQKTAWEFQLMKVQFANGCPPSVASTPAMGLHLVFADEAVGQAYPLETHWTIDCRRPTAMPDVFRTPKGHPAWVMFPAPRIDRTSTPPRVHFLTQNEVKPSTQGLPLSVAALTVTDPMTLTLRWRSRTAAGSIAPWTTQVITVRPSSVFTDAACAALHATPTDQPEVRAALLAHTCGATPTVPASLRTTP